MPQLVLEIGVEEMPARFLPHLMEELTQLLAQGLLDEMIDYGAITAYAAPRRIAAVVDDVSPEQRAEVEEVLGPPAKVAFDADGNPTKAALGFVRGQGGGIADAYTVDTDKGEYLALKVQKGGRASLEVLPGLLAKAVAGLSFPKKMKWGDGEFTFGRPMRWLLALLGDEVVRFELGGLAASNLTYGHRVMGPGPFEVASAELYLDTLRHKGRVVIDPQERKRSIMEDGQRKAQAVGGALIPNERLLEEVSGLVEYPRPILGAFDERYLELPAEVLLTSMESHQKSFGVRGPEGQLLNHFLTVLNIEPEDVELVRKGWQRVLKARLEDARFFWEDDIKASFDDWLAKLEHVVFLGPLGSMADKSRRIEMLCAWLATPHGAPLTDELPVAGKYAKCDLVSEMVYEFDTLQGIMGGIYARRQGMPENVARAIYEQYLPAGAESSVPETLPGALLSMADKMDTLVGIFGLDKAPTGAADPYALRRAALAVSRIIIEHDLRIDLDSFIEKAIDGYAGRELKLSPAETTAKLKDFFAGRLKALFTGQGMDTLVVEAAIGAGITDIRTLAMRLAALDEFSRRPDFEQSVLTFKRAANIIRKQGAEAGVKLTGRYEESLLQEEAERKLAARIHEVAPRFEELWAADAYGELLKLLGELRPSVDEFFDNVMVMADDPKLKLNRLNLLEALVAMLGRLADFNALQV